MSAPASFQINDADGDAYEAETVSTIFVHWTPILITAANVTPGNHLLDVASGTGIVARTCADQIGPSGRIVGIDLNPGRVRVAKRLRPDVDWHVGDTRRLPFSGGSFDRVLCQAGLMFVPDPSLALREMSRVLRSNGRIAVMVWAANDAFRLLQELLDESGFPLTADRLRIPFSMSSACDLYQMFQSSGFQSPNVTSRTLIARFHSLESFLKSYVEDRVPEETVDTNALIPDARRRLERYCQPDGRLAIPMTGHIATGMKYETSLS